MENEEKIIELKSEVISNYRAYKISLNNLCEENELEGDKILRYLEEME